ncbi:hypothetical protein DdX_18516 [Ditylenchus destructor]|uniref:Uncharacterized protein n=1 Tax=Ditylenchus destructor TaxID=166010 RepID=A0AAD4MJM7_9BILA|nr:hypothetical protein DdX_18516 [Ditylenchus destructor]
MSRIIPDGKGGFILEVCPASAPNRVIPHGRSREGDKGPLAGAAIQSGQKVDPYPKRRRSDLGVAHVYNRNPANFVFPNSTAEPFKRGCGRRHLCEQSDALIQRAIEYFETNGCFTYHRSVTAVSIVSKVLGINHKSVQNASERAKAKGTPESTLPICCPKKKEKKKSSMTPKLNNTGRKRLFPHITSREATVLEQSTEAVVKSVARRTMDKSSVSKPQKPKLDNYGQCGKSNNRNENAQRSCVVKVGPSLVNVLVTTNLSNNDSVDKTNETIEPESSSSLTVIKEEQSLIDELAESVPAFSDHRHSSDLYAENIKSTQTQTSSNPSVIKDEPSFFDELAADIHGPSNYEDSWTPSANGKSIEEILKVLM